MADQPARIEWAPRVAQSKVCRLYETDARGIYDEELIDDVGFALHARCLSFLAAEEARAGRALCHACGKIISHTGRPAEVLRCPSCGWEVVWRVYFRSIQHKQLSGSSLIGFFRDYVARFPHAATCREKMLLIDRLLHGFHWLAETERTRPSAVNLIEGSMSEVIAFLNELTYGEGSTPGTREAQAAWRKDMDATLRRWGAKGITNEET